MAKFSKTVASHKVRKSEINIIKRKGKKEYYWEIDSNKFGIVITMANFASEDAARDDAWREIRLMTEKPDAYEVLLESDKAA